MTKARIHKKQENWLAKHTYRKLANPLAIFLSKIGATSVKVSILSIFTALIAGVLFSLAEWRYLVGGYVFLQITLLLDHIDGAIARYTNNQTSLGSWYDKVSNKLHRFFFILGVSLGVFKSTGDSFFLFLGHIAGFLWIFSVYVSETKKIWFNFKGDTTFFKERSRSTIFPYTLLVTNIFGVLVLLNQGIWALWFITIISLNTFRHMYKTSRLWVKENT